MGIIRKFECYRQSDELIIYKINKELNDKKNSSFDNNLVTFCFC